MEGSLELESDTIMSAEDAFQLHVLHNLRRQDGRSRGITESLYFAWVLSCAYVLRDVLMI